MFKCQLESLRSWDRGYERPRGRVLGISAGLFATTGRGGVFTGRLVRRSWQPSGSDAKGTGSLSEGDKETQHSIRSAAAPTPQPPAATGWASPGRPTRAAAPHSQAQGRSSFLLRRSGAGRGSRFERISTVSAVDSVLPHDRLVHHGPGPDERSLQAEAWLRRTPRPEGRCGSQEGKALRRAQEGCRGQASCDAQGMPSFMQSPAAPSYAVYCACAHP